MGEYERMVKPAAPGTDVGKDLTESEQKLRREAINAASSAAHHVEEGEYEEALLASQRLHITIAKACACEQIRARFPGASMPTSGTGEK